jgi:hypothetical protein
MLIIVAMLVPLKQARIVGEGVVYHSGLLRSGQLRKPRVSLGEGIR